MASFNGFDLGEPEEFSTTAAPKDRQTTAYNGLDGLRSVDLGARGGESEFLGYLVASDPGTLAALKATLRGLQTDGGAYTYIDPEETEWGGVILTLFKTRGPRVPAPGGVMQKIELHFLHLS